MHTEPLPWPSPVPPSVRSLQALRSAPVQDLAPAAEWIRTLLIDAVGRTGGHLGPNLGVVELSLALHRVFTSPRDSIVFDTGHQAYVHKLLTGRLAGFGQLRQAGGLSGYPSRSESVHDLVENSHASTALAYADGLAKARKLAGAGERAVVAVIGDGALTGGMAWEGLNNLGAASDRPVIIVLNDNGRAYAPTCGALADHLATLRKNGNCAGPNLFTVLGFAYLGPLDGHDTAQVEAALHRARALRRPVVVHVVTVKGKGHLPAELDEADCLHAVGPAPAPGSPAPAAKAAAPSWTGVFGSALARAAAERPEVVAISAAMIRPTGLHPMAQQLPGRVFDVGIAEQHAVCSAAGLAMAGMHPVVAVYATFMSRALDQVLMDVALHRLPVTFVLDRAGVTGPDGSSHHGMWDPAVFGVVPGMRLAAPRDAPTLRALLDEALADNDGPTMLRFPKGNVPADLPAGRRLGDIDLLHQTCQQPRDVLLIGLGPLAAACLAAGQELSAHGLSVTVASPRWALPVPGELVDLAADHALTVTVEDGVRTGGIGSALAQACTDAYVSTPVCQLGLPRRFLPHGPRDDLLRAAGLDRDGITASALRAYDTHCTPPARRSRRIS
ncbi:1-deoxy-D-xylulose-5-phosphate synthase [Streptomyces sp. NPDC018045]|uniref:1-deoxy-D-xylulose-5-phosphate synthase n=1 Tax=Streptomyces sp. NPDC018045 TaxID=3365037 RepID=UPI0037A866DB